MRILICVYAAGHNDVAVEAAGRIAQATGGEVTALFVKGEPPERYKAWMDIPSGHRGKTIRELYQELESVTEQVFDSTDRILGNFGVKAKKLTAKGKPVKEILAHVESENYDLVVVGTTGLQGLQRSVVGSVSYEVAENAKAPVLVVKRRLEFNSMLICTDDSPDAERAEHLGAYIAEHLGMELKLLSVAPEGMPVQEAEECCRRGIEIASAEGVEAEAECRRGNVREAILAEAPGFDIVAVGSRGLSKVKRIFIGHISLHVVENADTNVLVVRECPLCDEHS